MPVTLELPENVEKILRDKAQKLGLSLETYIVDVLRQELKREFRPISNQGTSEKPWIRGYMSRTSFELEGGGTDFRIFPSQAAALDKCFESRKYGSLEVRIEPLRQLSIYEPLENDFQHPPLDKDAVLFYEGVKTKILALFEEHRTLVAKHDHYETRVRNIEEAIAYWFDYFDRFQSPLGLKKAFSLAIDAILIHPRPVWIHEQALQVVCDLGLISARRAHLKWMEQMQAFQRDLPGENFNMLTYERWLYSKKNQNAADAESSKAKKEK
jgi:plasmid stability protein